MLTNNIALLNWKLIKLVGYEPAEDDKQIHFAESLSLLNIVRRHVMAHAQNNCKILHNVITFFIISWNTMKFFKFFDVGIYENSHELHITYGYKNLSCN